MTSAQQLKEGESVNQIFTRKLKDELIEKIKHYFSIEMDQELGNFDAEFILDFFSENIGPHYYNQAIRDMQSHLANYLENLNDRMDELVKPVDD
ncbi:MAG: DUF2164 domain-containing protein [Candidatus Marinimicrobia bacterium]|nr:DUF2164 domain-containing protein [Candidatus Neomarinimicrobiota bacterium]